ncbi:uncharacterized protein LOC117116278 [Anneissia japonica]|uniref:uncharacterized protein LOC117116278 n=1 Tax=Anneissia japonica TaxID=1529436 RepID=UPI0014257E76|nr:uncharacterized protein LOC117116278 [Anneissia japonica]
MDINPKNQTVVPDEYLGTVRSVRPLSPASQHKTDIILQQLAPYYKYHGINIQTSFEDFDMHNIGLVTDSQFYRSFPRPPGLDENDLRLLARRYLDPDKPSLCNYLNLHHDLEKIQEKSEDHLFAAPPPASYNIPRENVPSGTTQQLFSKIQVAVHKNGVRTTEFFKDHDLEISTNVPSGTTQQLFSKIQVAVHKNGVRTTEFFKDHDKLRSGVITENQFVCGLMLCIGKEAYLTRGEVQHLVDIYKTKDGRVCYKDFCDLMENAFNEPHLEKKPEFEVVRPPQGALSRSLNPLTEKEEARVQEVLKTLGEDVKRRRLMMFQYFKDFDRASQTLLRACTCKALSRLLNFTYGHDDITSCPYIGTS